MASLIEARRRILLSAPHLEAASGDIATFKTDMAIPLKSLTVDIPVTQAGTGDPSLENARPFAAKTNVTVPHTGVNLLGGKQFADDLVVSCTNRAQRDGNKVKLPNGSLNVNQKLSDRVQMLRGGFVPGTHTIIIAQGSTDTDNSLITVFYTDGSSASINASRYNAATKRWQYVSSAAKAISFLQLNRDNSAPIEYDCDNSGVFVGNVQIDTTVPYNGSVSNISFPSEAGTVYGCTLTLNADGSGELTVKTQMVTIDGTDWQTGTVSGKSAFQKRRPSTIPTGRFFLSNYLTCVSSLAGNVKAYTGYAGGTYLNVYAPDLTLEEWQAALNASPLQVCFELYSSESWITYPLTAEQIRTLKGVNNIWSDAGTTTVKYWTH